ncbi:MAG: molybdopterin-dependent oxidoreductase, partial [Gemmatimonadales bacterium]
VPNLALRAERAPNLEGARLAGYGDDFAGALARAATADLVVLLDPWLTPEEQAALGRIQGSLVVLGTIASDALESAHVVLPVSTYVEEHGTFVNRDGRVQRFLPARTGPGMARPAWWFAAEALGVLKGGAVPDTAARAFARLADRIPALAGLTHESLGFFGRQAAAAGAAR